ncbi:hypothetical protein WICPIJ_005425 [Wickerhamomyces pijperi]|uniref:Chloride channel protein n=1 Tax=Wickerhamomyces pijperi TaxID=599730 RepID=A0A9P8Q3H8_WICPI|nr:hypothetical protein WICPIJ_005425 [Wickerhamomyces pijperi]
MSISPASPSPFGIDNDIPLESIRPNTNNNQIPTDILPNFSKYKTTEWTTPPHTSNPYLSQLQTYLILTVVGLSIGSVAATLNVLTEYLSGLKSGYCSTNVLLTESYCPESNWVDHHLSIPGYILFILLSLSFSSIACFSVLHFAPLAAGSGISEIKCIVSGFNYDSFLKWPVLLLKCIGLPLGIASGLSVGKEGPSVHYAVCAGSLICLLISKLLHNDGDQRRYKNVLISSSAAGVAVAFGSPMGGVLFSIEEISSSFELSTMWESYYCSLVAVSMLQFWNPFNNGKIVMFEVRYDRDWSVSEIPVFIVLGVFGGLYGVIVKKFNVKVANFRKKYLGEIPRLEVFILTFITVIIAYWNQFLKLDMTQSMQLLFQECSTDSSHSVSQLCELSSPFTVSFNLLSLLIATVLRVLFTIFTYGSRIPAGIFVPSMACGATFGRAIGILIQLLQLKFTDGCQEPSFSTCVNPGIYAFLGAASALSGITHLTVSVVVIMFELTGAVKYIIPTMISVAATTIVSQWVGDETTDGGIADLMIGVNKLPFIGAHLHLHFNETEVHEAMTSKDIVYLPYSDATQVNLIKEILETTEYSSFPVLKESTFTVKGLITREVLQSLVSGPIPPNAPIDITQHINYTPITAPPSQPLSITYQAFLKLQTSIVLIQSIDGKLQGLLTRKDLLRFEYLLNKAHYDEIDTKQRWSEDQKYNKLIQGYKREIEGYIDKLFRRDRAGGIFGQGQGRYDRL